MTRIREYSITILLLLATLATLYLTYGAQLRALVTETFDPVRREVVILR